MVGLPQVILQHVSEVLILKLGLVLHPRLVARFLVCRAVYPVATFVGGEHVNYVRARQYLLECPESERIDQAICWQRKDLRGTRERQVGSRTEEDKVTAGLDGVANQEANGRPTIVRCFGLLDNEGSSKVSPTVSSAVVLFCVSTKNQYHLPAMPGCIRIFRIKVDLQYQGTRKGTMRIAGHVG